ncbi:MAG: DUF748 domain-containing protein [Deltaproteobacteria bacterium]|nr:DUF748 domain-containing protein [Deltaproteobacteria bacterium]MDL1961265.1 DUF748 domain-containing protein [Deltaproteobacteria bacterium]
MERLKKFTLGIAIFFAVYTITGFLILPLIIKSVAIKKLSAALNRPVVIQKIKLNPYALSLTIIGLTVKEREEPADFVSFTSLYVNLQGVSIFKLAPVIKEFRLEGPFVRIVRNMDGGYNFSDLISSSEPSESTAIEKSPDSASGLFEFAVYNIQVLNGSADFLDQPKDKIHKISELNLAIPFLSDIGSDLEVFVQPHFSAIFNDKPVSMVGKTKPFADSLETVFDIELKGVDLPYYFAYVPLKTNLQITSGSLDVTVSLSYIQFKDKAPRLSSSGDLALKDLEIVDISRRPLLKLALFHATWLRSRFLAKDIHLTSVEFKSPEISITRDEAGMLNIHSLFPSAETEETTSGAEETKPLTLAIDEIRLDSGLVSLTDFFQIQGADAPEKTDILKLPALSIMDTSVDTARKQFTVGEISAEQGFLLIRRLENGDLNIQALTGSQDPVDKPSTSAENEPPWLATVKKLSIQNFTVQGKNLASDHDGNLTLDEISLEGRDISTKTNAKGRIDLSCKLNKAAAVGTRGEFGINPVVADLQLEISDLNLAWFQPFLAGILEVIVSDGKFSTTGALSLSQTEAPGLQAKYRGNVTVADFATKDNTQGDDFVRWKQLLINGIDVGISPIYVNINEIALEALDSRIVVNADGSLNLQNIVTAEAEKSPATSKPAEAQAGPALEATEPEDTETVPINIGKITCKDGKISFSDRSITPSYSANLVDIQGTVSGLISEETQRADVSFKGKLNGYAPLEITGTINPLMEDLFVDLKVRFKDIDLSPASPYSGKYVGHKIQKGKLSLDLSYLIDRKKLDSTNNVYIDQFDFGESVESPDSLNLPVKLAVSLLKDRSGEIVLRLPVTGRIDDPEFSVSGIVLKMIKNILIKAATSPFSLISATFGSGEDLSHFEFDAGSAELTDADKTKLDTLVKALYERPRLQLEVTGFADIEKDRQGLITYRFEKQIKAQKFKKMKKKEAAAVSVDSVTIAPEEYEKYLKMAYKAGKFKKPKNILGITKNISVPEMEALILENIQITDDDLRSLANERAQVVKNYILGQGEIEPERLFLIEPEALTPEKVENLKDSRVDLSFK